jgi:hypothetical protein
VFITQRSAIILPQNIAEWNCRVKLGSRGGIHVSRQASSCGHCATRIVQQLLKKRFILFPIHNFSLCFFNGGKRWNYHAVYAKPAHISIRSAFIDDTLYSLVELRTLFSRRTHTPLNHAANFCLQELSSSHHAANFGTSQ